MRIYFITKKEVALSDLDGIFLSIIARSRGVFRVFFGSLTSILG